MSANLRAWEISADDYPEDSFSNDQLEFLLGYAILAPSTHNTQPWLFRLNAMDVELFADSRRALRVVDPAARELLMSCGAALMNLRIAAEYFSHSYQLELFPKPAEPNLFARFQLGQKCETTSEDILLFHAIPRRHTNRQPFREDPPPGELLAALEAGAQSEGAWFQVVAGDEARAAVADLVAEADRRQWADKHFREELATWVRTLPELARDGLPVRTFGVKDWLAFAGPAIIRTFDRGGGQAATDRDLALHSPVLGVLGTDQDAPLDWLKAGQALQQLLLRALSEDVSASFLNQPVELPETRESLRALLGRAGYPQALLRLGYGPPASPTPRRSVRDLLIKHTAAHP